MVRGEWGCPPVPFEDTGWDGGTKLGWGDTSWYIGT